MGYWEGGPKGGGEGGLEWEYNFAGFIFRLADPVRIRAFTRKPEPAFFSIRIRFKPSQIIGSRSEVHSGMTNEALVCLPVPLPRLKKKRKRR